MMELTTLQTIRDNFINELILSEKGEKTSLAYIRNIIPSSPLVQNNETFQVMAIGGTNFRTALVKKTSEGLEILSLNQEAQPPTFKNKENLLSFITSHLFDDISILALNFAFPLEPVFAHGKLEGNVLLASKEHDFEGLYGQNLCTEIENYIEKNLGRQIKVSAANDTICLLLSGTTQITDYNLAAGIVGTGVNFSFFQDKTTLINTESGGFNKFSHSPTIEAIDNMSVIKGLQLFEKGISGAYLYKHFNILASQKGIEKTITTTRELDTLVRQNTPEGHLAKDILQDSAQLVACALAGITEYKKESLTFVMQGSLFWKAYEYKNTVEETFQKLAPAYTIHFIDIENSDILGAAKLVA